VIDLSRRDGRPLRIGHRGAGALAPENSLEAIALAVELGCDLVEFDVHEVGGALVVAHDRPVAADGLPGLDDVLDYLATTGAGVHLDLKSRGAEAAVAEGLRRHGLVERTLVSSFRRPVLRALHAVEPGLRLGRTYPQDRTGLTKRAVFHPPARAIVRALRRALPRRVGALLARSRATAAVLYWEVLSEAVVERCHALGAPVLAWTVDDEELLPWLDRIGVDGVITNDPGIFRRLDSSAG
jgi:glycerophosphoryl diester phosphodiesterase